MTMPVAQQSFFPLRLSQYIPGMQYAHSVTAQGQVRIVFGALLGSNTTAYVNAANAAVAGVATAANGLLQPNITDANYGRCLQVLMSIASTGTVMIDGFDYLGQPMSELITLSASTGAQTNKCFKVIRQVTWSAMAGATISVGFLAGGRNGVPYRLNKVLTEENGGIPNATVGAPNYSTLAPQTLTSVDPRGWYTLNNAGSCNGVNIQTITAECCNDVDPITGAGGLHGMPHFSN
jgi:hypothetical protein